MSTDDARSHEQLSRLQAVSDAVLAHVELEPLLDALLTTVREALDADTAAVLLLSEDRTELVARAAKGLEEQVARGVRVPLGEGFAGQVAAERRPVTIPRLTEAHVVNPVLREKGIVSMLGVPLVANDEVIGVMHVGTLTERVFTDVDADLVTLAADRAALAIDHARVYAEARQAAASLERLQEVTDVALLHVSLEQLLDELLTRIRRILDADTAAILIVDDERGELVARAAKGIEEEVEAGVRIPIGRGFAGKIAAERRPIAIANVDEADIFNPILREKGLKSLLGAPLLLDDRLIGVVHVGTLHPRVFTREDSELLQRVAARAALGIENARVRDELRLLDELKSNFVAFAAHELRAPAASIRGLTETLHVRGPELDTAQLDDLHAALRDESVRLTRMIDQLLDLSRLEAAATTISPRRVDVRSVVEPVVATLPPELREHVTVSLPEDVEWHLDPTAVERVVGNLVANALNHGSPPVVVTALPVDRHLRIAVEDRGEGVPHELVPRLFERFERGGRAASGSGLGLAIARAYARAHGGDIFYERSEPRGSRFTFVVPCARG